MAHPSANSSSADTTSAASVPAPKTLQASSVLAKLRNSPPHLSPHDTVRISALRDDLERGLLQRVPQSRVNAATAPRTPNTTNIRFPGVDGEALLIALDLKGLSCSTGAACSSGAVEPSHVLTAIGLTPAEARSSLRFSLGRPTTRQEIDAALLHIPQAVEQLREISPNYPNQMSASS